MSHGTVRNLYNFEKFSWVKTSLSSMVIEYRALVELEMASCLTTIFCQVSFFNAALEKFSNWCYFQGDALGQSNWRSCKISHSEASIWKPALFVIGPKSPSVAKVLQSEGPLASQKLGITLSELSVQSEVWSFVWRFDAIRIRRYPCCTSSCTKSFVRFLK